MALTQAEKAQTFEALHAPGSTFVIGNPWDAGSALGLASLGYEALATSSGAKAAALGRRDGRVTRAEALAHARLIVEAVDLPVSADLEKGFGDRPSDAADTIREAGLVGLVGGSIEDASGNDAAPIYDLDHAVQRVTAAVNAACSHPFKFILTARCENFVRGNPDLDDTIRRLKAYEAAGADVLMAPGLPDLAAVHQVCSSLQKPFNFMAGIKGRSFSVGELANAGVTRVSLATSLYRAAMTAALAAAREVKEKGSFSYLDQSLGTPDLNAFLKG
jgi:2-methylisocitrate lyase-like PEP mutase family enzyme